MKNILDICFIKEGKFKPQSLGGDYEITIKQLTIAQTEQYLELMREGKNEEAVHYAVKCSMVEPAFFSEDEFKYLNNIGKNLIYEIHTEIPLIGKTNEERQKHNELLEKLSRKTEEKESEDAKEKKH